MREGGTERDGGRTYCNVCERKIAGPGAHHQCYRCRRTPDQNRLDQYVKTDTDHWTEQDECQDCGREDVPLRAIQMVNGSRKMLCQDCFETAVDVGEVDPEDPRLQTRGESHV